jgi:hypothetical protein
MIGNVLRDSRTAFFLLASIGVLFTHYVIMQYCSTLTANNSVRAGRIEVDRPDQQLKNVSAERPLNISYALTNATEKDIRVVGARVSCGCTAVTGLPITLHNGSTEKINVTVAVPRASRALTGEVILLTDDDAQRIIPLRYTATVVTE